MKKLLPTVGLAILFGMICQGCKSSSQPSSATQPAAPANDTAQAAEAPTATPMAGPGTFARQITKQDFPLGSSVTDLIWMDQVNGTISKEEALKQYFCTFLQVDPPCLDPKYTQESNPDFPEPLEIAPRILNVFQQALIDPDISANAKNAIQAFLQQGKKTAPQKSISKSLSKVTTDVFPTPPAANNDSFFQKIANAFELVLNDLSCLDAKTPNQTKIKICAPPVDMGTTQSYMEETKRILESPDSPWTTFLQFFGQEPDPYDEAYGYSINIVGLRPGASFNLEGMGYLALSTQMIQGPAQMDYLRGTFRQDDWKKILRAILSHELYHAFSGRNAELKHYSDPFEEAHANVAIEMAAPETNIEQKYGKPFLGYSPAGAHSFTLGNAYYFHHWQYYLSKLNSNFSPLKNYLDFISSGGDPFTWITEAAQKNSQWLHFGVTLLNLNWCSEEQGILCLNAKDPGGYPDYIRVAFKTLGFLPGEMPADKISYPHLALKPLSLQYFPMMTTDGVNQNGVWPHYEIEPKFSRADIQIGVVAIKTDPYDRSNYHVINYREIPANQKTSLIYSDERPDLLLFVLANPVDDYNDGALILTAEPASNALNVNGNKTITYNGTNGTTGEDRITLEGKLKYQINEGSPANFEWVDVQRGPKQFLEKLQLTCPTTNQEKWKWMQGTLQVSRNLQSITHGPCNRAGVQSTTTETWQGGATYDLSQTAALKTSLRMGPQDGSWNFESAKNDSMTANQLPSVEHITKTVACDGKETTVPETQKWDWGFLTLDFDGSYKTGDTTLTYIPKADVTEERKTLTIDLPEPAYEISSIDSSRAQSLFYAVDDAPGLAFRGQLIPPLIDDVGFVSIWPNCGNVNANTANGYIQQTEQNFQRALDGFNQSAP